MNIKKSTTRSERVQRLLTQRPLRLFKLPSVLPIKRAAGGKRYFVIPVPSRQMVVRYIIILLALFVVAMIGWQLYRYFGPHTYRVSASDSLLSEASDYLARSLSYNKKERAFVFSHGSGMSPTARQSGSGQVAATLPVDARRGATVTDPNYKISLTMKPQISLAAGRQQKNRVIYPFRDHSGWLVYTAEGTGIKEDIILKEKRGDRFTAHYLLGLPEGTEARQESDGSIGIYGNELFINSISTGTNADASLLKKARENAQKNLLLFVIPKPTVRESGKASSSVTARYELSGHRLSIRVTNLANAHYPLTIDPSIYIVTAQQFMNGNNETNINFDVANKLIKKGRTTGARFDSWNTTTRLPQANWAGGTAVAGGYLYSTGGLSLSGQIFSTQGASTFTVPAGVTSISVKMWGGGGGGGAGGSAAAGGAGGAGGYVNGTIAVTPNETLAVYVGGGGTAGTRNASGGGGGGGGYSSIYRGATPLAIASGGGGGGGGRSNSAHIGGGNKAKSIIAEPGSE